MQTGRSLGQVCFSYATDNTANGNTYPSDATAFAIGNDLLKAGYATDPNIFGISSQTGFTAPTSTATGSTLVAASCSWCFTTLGTTTTSGINANASDLVPLVYFNNGFSTSPTGATTFTPVPGTGLGATVSSAAPFQTDGMAIFYKGNNATYVKSVPSGTGTIPVGSFVSANCTDSTAYTVAQ